MTVFIANRPPGRSALLREAFAARDWIIEDIPCFDIVHNRSVLPAAWAEGCDLLLISSSAAIPCIEVCMQQGLLRGMQICAVGPTTAQALFDLGFSPTIAGKEGGGLRELVPLLPSGIDRILYMAAARPALSPEELSRLMQAEVRHWPAYRVELRKRAIRALRENPWVRGGECAILHFSGAAVDAFDEVAAKAGVDPWLPVHFGLGRTAWEALERKRWTRRLRGEGGGVQAAIRAVENWLQAGKIP